MRDVAIVGGGPAGLAAGLALCRARKRVVIFDCWPPRNAAATEVRGFVTQDGLLLRAWTRDLIVFTNAGFSVPSELREELTRAQVQLEDRPIVGLRVEHGQLAAVTLAGGQEVARDVLFVRPPQTQTPLVTTLVTALGLRLDARDLVHVADYETSVPGIYAAGDLMIHEHGASAAAAAGAGAAHALDGGLTRELVLEGLL